MPCYFVLNPPLPLRSHHPYSSSRDRRDRRQPSSETLDSKVFPGNRLYRAVSIVLETRSRQNQTLIPDSTTCDCGAKTNWVRQSDSSPTRARFNHHVVCVFHVRDIFSHIPVLSHWDLPLDNKGLQPSDPRLYAVHPACVRIARVSGPAQTFNGLKRGVKDPYLTWIDHPLICSTTSYPALRQFLGLRCHSLLGSLFAHSTVEMTFIVRTVPRRFSSWLVASDGRYSKALPGLHSPTETRTRNIFATGTGRHNHPDR